MKQLQQENQIVEEKSNLTIFVTFDIPGYHYWPNPPDNQYTYLSRVHRHNFHFEIELFVEQANREIEIIQFKDEIIHALHFKYNITQGIITEELAEKDGIHSETPILFGALYFDSMSCEMICKEIAKYLEHKKYKYKKILVSEDKENGACLYG